ncbi:Polypyrimidine tract-binding protein 2, partial [Sarracenia purpurea var. burkii]
MLHMDKLRLFGKEIRVMQSKYQTVQLPKEGQPDAGLTKDYTLSPLHRFKNQARKIIRIFIRRRLRFIYLTFHKNVSEEEIKNAFQKNGFEVREFRFFP